MLLVTRVVEYLTRLLTGLLNILGDIDTGQ